MAHPPSINLLEHPWSKMKKSAVCAVAKEYQSEINCRWGIMYLNNPNLKATSVPPHPSQWTLPKVQKWLADNLVTDDVDEAFLLASVVERIAAAARADTEASAISALLEWAPCEVYTAAL